ncbi:hypothetical protein PF004_g26562 [Phytophthora fragariae]|uniref:Transmembrane protein n=4 Tax=Phytophthora fragariae TaxID=53985 RepID=A0A6A3HRL6_9STRA|nr:hypothetical protein PF011_g26456 [Phytophthora fragariae]KAE9174809.1 hypothetical protein PF004_g26562 [Phytophthora fragariae]
MIHPSERTSESSSCSKGVLYQIVACGDKLPAFDPLLMLKTVALSPNSLKQFNDAVLKLQLLLFQSVIVAIGLRYAAFAAVAPLGRPFAVVSAVLHIPGMVVFGAGMRAEYLKIILPTFDFCFLQAANTLWAITFSVVLKDVRVVLVVVCWANFTNSLFQETYLRNTVFMITFTLFEWLFNALLMVWLAVGLVEDVHHYTFVTARGHTLSTKDILVNTMGTMAMVALRHLYRRYQHTRRQKKKRDTAMQALGYRCKIALSEVDRAVSSANSDIMPHLDIRPRRERTYSSRVDTNVLASKRGKYPPLQMYLATGMTRFDAQNTIWPNNGVFKPAATWKIVLLYSCGATGGLFAVLALFLPNAEIIAGSGLLMSAVFSGTYLCCCERQLLKRVITSFHFMFFAAQILSTGVCVMDMFYWRWAPACGVASSLLLAYTILTIDALTPLMKRHLCYKFWMPVTGILLFWAVEMLLLVDMLQLGIWNLQDRVFLDISIFNHRAQFHVAPFFLGRLVTIFVWSGRYVYVALTRQDDNTLVMLRGEVEFDYESWKKQARLIK